MAAKLLKTRTPGIYKRGKRYVFSYRVDGRQRWESHRTLDAARLAKAARATDIHRGEHQEHTRITLHEYALEWVGRYQGRGRRGFRENTREEYHRQLHQYILYHFPSRLRLTDLTPSQVAQFLAWLCDEDMQGKRAVEQRRIQRARKLDVDPQTLPLGDMKPLRLSDATISNTLAPLRACLASAVREGLIRTSPARDIDLPHRPTLNDEEQEVKALTRAQLTALLGALPDNWRLCFWLLAATGLRVSEALALQWKHLELTGPSPHVKVRRAYVRGKFGPPKSRYGKREIPIDTQLAQTLREHHQTTRLAAPEHLVFPSTAGSTMDQGNLRERTLKPAARKADVPWAGFHTFRHTCATLLFAQGANAVQVQRWLGHHSPAFTLARYVHLLDNNLGQPLSIQAPSANKVQTRSTPNQDTQPQTDPSNSSRQATSPCSR